MTHRPRTSRCPSLAICACLAAYLLVGIPVQAVDTAVGQEISSRRLTYVVRAVRAARPAVVNIQGQKVVAPAVQTAAGSEAPRQVNGMGTGIVVDERGYILTNYHVVADVRRIQVTLYDHREYTAELVARDAQSDLALIKIPVTEPLALIKIGTSSDLMEGEPVIALGNAFGYEHTVTRGIISALGRDVQVSDTQTYDDLIQTDASINPGNSGGPLMNVEGEMIGLNVAVRAGAQGIGFAIPVDQVMKVAAQLLSVEQLENKRHGLVTHATNEPGAALVVDEVQQDSPAAAAGLRAGDEICEVAQFPVARPLDLERALLDHTTGEKIPLTVIRNGERMTMDLELANCSKAWDVLGLELTEEPKDTFQKRASRYRGGMRVVEVRPTSPAASEGIRPGDVLVGMHGWETASTQDIDYIVTRPNLAELGSMKFYVLRGKSMLYGHLDMASTAAVAAESTKH
ncbi:MAG: trypsin-like peptidase domain-containing protein [Pirellulales bacterium]